MSVIRSKNILDLFRRGGEVWIPINPGNTIRSIELIPYYIPLYLFNNNLTKVLTMILIIHYYI